VSRLPGDQDEYLTPAPLQSRDVEAGPTPAAPRPEPRLVRPPSPWPTLGLHELWRFHELLFFLAWRELKVRYKQTLLGVAWAALQPLAYMVVFTLLFSKVFKIFVVGPYPLLALSGSVIWLFFANSVTIAAGSLVGNAALLTKVYFPRLLSPLAPILAALVDLAVAFVVLLGVMAAYGTYPAPSRVWTIVPFVLLAMGTAFGVGAWLSALNVKYRDVRFVVPLLLQLWMFVSAVFYSFQSLGLEEPLETIFWLNPMAGAVEGFRWALLGGIRPSFEEFAISSGAGLAVLTFGLLYFRRKERQFADIV
jgi:lipopolysaccharide transport system permease protein